MSDADLLDIARRVAGAARPDEQVEAYVVRSRETEVEVFGGEVESLTTAVVEGIGVRVVVDHRQGYAWAGSFEPSVVEETLREARDNAAFGEPDEWYALASPADANGVTPPTLDVWREELGSVPTDEKVRVALELERATKAVDPRIRNVESAGYGDSLTIGNYKLVCQSYTQDSNANYDTDFALMDVYRGGKKIAQMSPEKRFYQASQTSSTIVAIHSTPLRDLYVVFEGRNPDTNRPILKVFLNPLVSWIWVGVAIIVAGTFLALLPGLRPALSSRLVASVEPARELQPVGGD